VYDMQEKQAALKEELASHVEQRARDRSGAAAAAVAGDADEHPPGADIVISQGTASATHTCVQSYLFVEGQRM
jgi:hypothetical protein